MFICPGCGSRDLQKLPFLYYYYYYDVFSKSKFTHFFSRLLLVQKKIEKNTRRFVTKFSVFSRNFLANLNISYIVYVTFVNQRDSTQRLNFGSTLQPLLWFPLLCWISCQWNVRATPSTYSYILRRKLLIFNGGFLLPSHRMHAKTVQHSALHNRIHLLLVAPLFLYWYSAACAYFRFIIFQCYRSNLLHISLSKFYRCVARRVCKKCVNLLFENPSYYYYYYYFGCWIYSN